MGAVHRAEKAEEGLSLFQLKQVGDTPIYTSLPRGPGVVVFPEGAYPPASKFPNKYVEM